MTHHRACPGGNFKATEKVERLRRAGRRFARGRSGVAATEFALVLPILLTMWLGMVGLLQLTNASAKTTMAAQSVADLIAQGVSGASDYQNLVGAAATILSSADANNPTVVVVNLTFDGQGKPAQSWQCSSGSNVPTATQLTSSINGATGLGSSGQTVIMVTVTYSYTPTITGGILGAETFSETAYETPRLGQSIPKPC